MLSQHFHSLLATSAQGFFFMRAALVDETTDEQLTLICKEAHEQYSRILMSSSEPGVTAGFVPVIAFREPAAAEGFGENVILMEISRISDPAHKVIFHVALRAVAAQYGYTLTLAAPKSQPIPETADLFPIGA